MTISRIATALSVIGAAFIIYVGFGFLTDPEAAASGFGMPAWPHGDAADFLNVKGDRDVVMGLLILALLAFRQRFALGITMLVMALAPVSDMLIVLAHNGSTAAAFGIHGLTAALVALTGVLLLREPRTATIAASTVSPATVR
ncbi:DUF4267 domain-containing protein [Nocardia sp. NBC_01503]|uniref:DUF4267 domain-containing protein n=1 Tax=Nocardia sp. NBC_01503 TaxID=2975997 RepID=UPI002E7BB1F6|nr:DUF4267 domain-containing protein [Nocardia sp. NBC_01503]WTL35921.1 DUF4267 domain-containing protein [Nocardia sp. NBC_01503]